MLHIEEFSEDHSDTMGTKFFLHFSNSVWGNFDIIVEECDGVAQCELYSYVSLMSRASFFKDDSGSSDFFKFGVGSNNDNLKLAVSGF